MNNKQRDELLEMLKEAISFCIPYDDYNMIHLKIEKAIIEPKKIKLIRKWLSE